jgi:hypothetical protein
VTVGGQSTEADSSLGERSHEGPKAPEPFTTERTECTEPTHQDFLDGLGDLGG